MNQISSTFKNLAIFMVIFAIIIVIASIISGCFITDFESLAKFWYISSGLLSLFYFLIFFFHFSNGLRNNNIAYENKDKSDFIILKSAVVPVLFIVIAIFLAYVFSKFKSLYVLPSVILAWGLFWFDWITINDLKISGEWKDIFGDSLSLDFSVATSLSVIFLYCIFAYLLFDPICSKDIFTFAAGSSAFSLLISTGSFSYSLIQTKN